MTLENRISAFSKLGDFLSQFSIESIEKKENIEFNELFFDIFKTQIKRAKETNGWFTEENVLFSLKNWSESLTKDNLINWTSKL